MPWKCCVWKCKSTVKSTGVKLFRFPSVGKCLQQLASERIEEWKNVLGYGKNFTPFNKRICNIHFRSGKPARLTDTQDPDWVPSQHLTKPSSSILCMKQRSNDSNRTPEACSSASDSRESNRFSPDRSDTKLSSVRRGQRSTDSNPTPKACSSASDSRESNSFSPDQSDTKLSCVRRDSRESSGDSMSVKSWDSMSPKSQSFNSSKLSSRQKSRTASTASMISIESSHVSQRSSGLHSRSPGSKSFLRPNITPLLSYDYKDDQPKMKNASTMTEACSEPDITFKMVENYQRELQRLQGKICSLQNQAVFFKRGFEFISVSDKKCLYYTGITSFSTVKKIYEYLKPNLNVPYCDFSTEQMFVMTLTKLRLNQQFQTLAYDYNVCLNTISKYFHRTLNIMDTCLYYALDVPSKDVLLKHTPKAVKEKMGENRIFVVDCFEIHSETPDELKAAAQHYSNYKKSETTKFLIALSPDGNICFISPGYGGRCSDKLIVKDCGFLNILEPGDVVLADKGFDISDLVQSRGAYLNIPTFLKDKKQFRPSDIEKDRQITSVRIHVERGIGVLKMKYLVMSQIVTVTSLTRFEDGKNVIDLIARVCAILYNFNPSIIPD